MLQIIPAHIGNDLKKVRELFMEYASSLNVSLDFQNSDEELTNLSGNYAPPTGCLLLSLWNGNAAGCAALRDKGNKICEMKRLYTRPQFRGLKIGKGLTGALINKARILGYTRMRLDTLPTMKVARKM